MNFEAVKFRGRHRMITAGTRVTDKAELGKAICLCWRCQPKFDAPKYNYLKLSRPPLNQGAVGVCDGCKQTEMCKIYMKE